MSILCKNCTSGYILPGEPKGSLLNESTEKDACYFSPAPNNVFSPALEVPTSVPATASESQRSTGEKLAVILLTDIFGLQLKNPKIIADNFSKRLNCDVYVPDLFEVAWIDECGNSGRYALSEAELAPYIPDVPKTHYSMIDNIKRIMIIVRNLPRLWATRPAVGVARAETFIKKLKEKNGYAKIGVVGYCYGGGVCLQLATKPKLVDVIVACHPGPVWINDLRTVGIPLAVLCSEGAQTLTVFPLTSLLIFSKLLEDEWIPPAKRVSLEAVLRSVTAADTKVQTFNGASGSASVIT
ncbi:hypothetical protein FRC17_005674 [Serendipita sp. 399]|nr:hypothetical protein FRC17_005674 [Serendipita sp. 399]